MVPTGREIAVAIVGSPVLSLIVKATVVAAVALVAARLARRRRASIRHVMSAMAFVVLLTLPLVAAVAPAHPVMMPIVDPVPMATPVPALPVLDVPATVAPTAGASPAAGRDHPPVNLSVSTVLLTVWVGGTALVLLPMLQGFAQLRRVRRNGVPWRDGERLLGSIASRMPLRRSPRVLLDYAADGPMTCGFVHPILILPRDAQHWSKDDLQ